MKKSESRGRGCRTGSRGPSAPRKARVGGLSVLHHLGAELGADGGAEGTGLGGLLRHGGVEGNSGRVGVQVRA